MKKYSTAFLHTHTKPKSIEKSVKTMNYNQLNLFFPNHHDRNYANQMIRFRFGEQCQITKSLFIDLYNKFYIKYHTQMINKQMKYDNEQTVMQSLHTYRNANEIHNKTIFKLLQNMRKQTNEPNKQTNKIESTLKS